MTSRLDSFRVRVSDPLDEPGANILWSRRTCKDLATLGGLRGAVHRFRQRFVQRCNRYEMAASMQGA